MPEKSSVRKDGDEYELVPKKQIEYLQQEVDRLKRNPLGDTQHARDLYGIMYALNQNFQKLVTLLQGASDEIVRDYKDEALTHKVNILLKQNEKLGEGVVLIADLLKELKAHFKGESSPSSQPSQPQPSQAKPSQAKPSQPSPPQSQGAAPAKSQESFDWGPPPASSPNHDYFSEPGNTQDPWGGASQGNQSAQSAGGPPTPSGSPQGPPPPPGTPPGSPQGPPPPGGSPGSPQGPPPAGPPPPPGSPPEGSQSPQGPPPGEASPPGGPPPGGSPSGQESQGKNPFDAFDER